MGWKAPSWTPLLRSPNMPPWAGSPTLRRPPSSLWAGSQRVGMSGLRRGWGWPFNTEIRSTIGTGMIDGSHELSQEAREKGLSDIVNICDNRHLLLVFSLEFIGGKYC